MDEVGGENVGTDLFYWLAGPPFMWRPLQQKNINNKMFYD